MKKLFSSILVGVVATSFSAGLALAHPNEHACNGNGGANNPAGQGLTRAAAAGGNVSCTVTPPPPPPPPAF